MLTVTVVSQSHKFKSLNHRLETEFVARALMEAKRLISRNFVKIDEEKELFQLFFLRNDENQSVEVEEVKEIDFRKVKEHLEQGESVFITFKRKEKVEPRLVEGEPLAETWYFTRI